MFSRRLLVRAVRTLTHRYYSMDLKEVVSLLDGFASPSLAESWDNVGLLLKPYTERQIKTVLLTNDLTKEVMEEAVESRCDLILSYHPPLFRPFKRITTGWKDRIVACCLEKGIAVYSPHTAYDTLFGGVNDWLIKAFDVRGVVPLQQKDVSPTHTHKVEVDPGNTITGEILREKLTQDLGDKVSVMIEGKDCMKILCGERDLPTIVSVTNTTLQSPKLTLTKLEKVPLLGHGAGRKGQLVQPITIEEAVTKVKTHLGLSHLRIALANGATLSSEVSSVGVCAGSGVSVLRGTSADLWLTGEMSHHEVLDAAHAGSSVILVEHSNSERGYLKGELQPALHSLFEFKINVLVSNKDRDPLQIV